MKIWLITIGEPLPLQGNERLLRTGIFANHLFRSGHDVTWWTSTFDHVRKQHVASESKNMLQEDQFNLFLLKGCGYKKNVSIARMYDHYVLSRRFKQNAEKEIKPDIILCSFPAIELSVEAVRYGRKHGIPVVLDVRDLWPDIFLEIFPDCLQFIGKILLCPLSYSTKVAFRGATAITGITRPFVEWGIKKAGRKRRPLDQDFPMGYPIIKFKPDETKNAIEFWQKKGVNEIQFLIVFFGYFGRQFDLETVLQAAADLQELPVNFILCGSGDNYTYYKDMAEELPNVILPGWVGRVEIATLMNMASIGLMPYVVKADFLNSIPNKFIEYLSAGLPILTTLHGEVGSLLNQKKCGFLYKNVEELTSIIKKLLNNKQILKPMATAARNLFNERFEASLVYSGMEQYLIDVVYRFQKEK